MDFNDNEKEAKFRSKVREFLDKNARKRTGSSSSAANAAAPETLQGKAAQIKALQDAKNWQAKKAEAGLAAILWPKEYGGFGGTPIEQVIYQQEELNYFVHSGYFEIGIGMLGPTMMTWGKDEDKIRYLPKMLTGEEIWCQLFSEPSAGSDLAGIKMKAEKDGDEWVLNGQKVWTSGAHFADYGMIVARSDPNAVKHKGLTYFFLDMKTPGIEVKPIEQISGSSNFNEVFFNDVRIPDSQRLGNEGDGWKVSLTTLMNERLAVGDASGPDFEEAFSLARGQDLNGKLAIENDSVREKLADWYCQQSGLKYAKYRNISALSRGETPGPQSSITKIVSGNKLQEIANFGLDMLDSAGILRTDEEGAEQSMYQYGFYGAAGIRIAGGTDEILKNIISEQVLGMPQDMRADKGLPFNEIPTGNK